jgi:hypothetical protein
LTKEPQVLKPGDNYPQLIEPGGKDLQICKHKEASSDSTFSGSFAALPLSQQNLGLEFGGVVL